MSYKDEAQLQKRRKIFSRGWKYVIFVCAIATLTIVVLFFAKLFDVRTVTTQLPNALSVEQVSDVIQEVLDERVLGITRRHNSVLLPMSRIRSVLITKFPRIQSVEVTRLSIHDLQVVIHERKRSGIWCFPAQTACYYYDDEGIAFDEIAPSTGSLFIPIQDNRDRRIILGAEVESETWRNKLGDARKILQFGNIPIARIEIPADSFDLFEVITQEGWKILFSIGTDVRLQASSLQLFLKDKISAETRKNLEYIDLRIEDRIYYK